MSRGTFFSRASTSTSITSSRFPVTTSSQFRYQAGALDILERQPHRLSFELHAHLPALCTAQHAYEPAPAARVGRTHSHVRLVPRKALEIVRPTRAAGAGS